MAALLRKITRARVAHGHGRVTVLQHKRHRPADHERTTDHADARTLEHDAGALEQLDHRLGGAGREADRFARVETEERSGVMPSTSLEALSAARAAASSR